MDSVKLLAHSCSLASSKPDGPGRQCSQPQALASLSTVFLSVANASIFLCITMATWNISLAPYLKLGLTFSWPALSRNNLFCLACSAFAALFAGCAIAVSVTCRTGVHPAGMLAWTCCSINPRSPAASLQCVDKASTRRRSGSNLLASSSCCQAHNTPST